MLSVIMWIYAHSGQMWTTVGLLCDICGAFLVASEVVQQFRGKKLEDARALTESGSFVFGAKGGESREYQSWEASKYRKMRWGLVFLVIGFLLQAIGAWAH
jgi:hypothetical protein